MKTTIVAIPSTHPGGLEAPLGAHFGHCDLYTLVKIADGRVQEVATLPNVPPPAGRLPGPGQSPGAARRPGPHCRRHGYAALMGFNQVGIEVLFGNGAQTVGEAVEALLNAKLPRFTNEFTCGGGGGAPQT